MTPTELVTCDCACCDEWAALLTGLVHTILCGAGEMPGVYPEVRTRLVDVVLDALKANDVDLGGAA